VENSHILKICCSLKKRTGKNIDSEKTWVFYSFILKHFSTSESTPGLLYATSKHGRVAFSDKKGPNHGRKRREIALKKSAVVVLLARDGSPA